MDQKNAISGNAIYFQLIALAIIVSLIAFGFWYGMKKFGPDIYHAARYDDAATVANFLRKNPKLLNAPDRDGKPPVYYACGMGAYFDACQYLVDMGADQTFRDDQGRTLLHVAASWPHSEEKVRLLISKGLDVNAKDNAGNTPLHDAENPEVKKILIENGAKIQ